MTVLLLATATACASGSSSTSAQSGSTSPTSATTTGAPTTGNPVGIIAIGHSALTGENSDPGKPGVEVRENSWATGTNSAVDSIYQRMVALRPETSGHVANLAEGGAPAARLADQAKQALAQVPAPALAIIQTIDNDIRCDGTDASHVTEFGSQVSDALTVITTASPGTRVLVLTQPGRPAAEITQMAPLIASNPQVKENYTGPAPCGAFDPATGKPTPKNVASLTAIIEAYEAEQARVCAKFPACSTDLGKVHAFSHDPSVVSSDFNHLNIAGHTKIAALVWPSAQAALAGATATP